MHAKKLIVASFFLLTACTGSRNIARYQLAFDVQEDHLRQELTTASRNVLERRLESLGEAATVGVDTDSGTVLEADISDEAIQEILTQELTKPFSLQIMAQAEPDEADIVVEGHGGFKATGITGEDLDWVQSAVDENGKGVIELRFTDAGRAKMAELFSRTQGQYIGLFVREKLVSKLLVETDELKDDIVIRDIPTSELADVFADDVNTGLHVTFIPLP